MHWILLACKDRYCWAVRTVIVIVHISARQLLVSVLLAMAAAVLVMIIMLEVLGMTKLPKPQPSEVSVTSSFLRSSF